MGDALPDLPGLAQAGLGAGLLVVLYLKLLVHHRQDRNEGRAERAALVKAHKAELAEARSEIADLRQQLDAQRRRTWAAEDAAAKYRRQLGLPHLGVDGDH